MLVAKAARVHHVCLHRTARATDSSAALESQRQIAAIDKMGMQMVHGPWSMPLLPATSGWPQVFGVPPFLASH
jgi:hypothetical protein